MSDAVTEKAVRYWQRVREAYRRWLKPDGIGGDTFNAEENYPSLEAWIKAAYQEGYLDGAAAEKPKPVWMNK